jgi:ferredoxin-NADP reductase
MNLKVERIVRETHDTATLFMVDADEGGRPFDFTAGQYLTFRFDDLAAKPIVRSYTMSSSPRQMDFVAVTVKKVDHGLVSHWLCDQVTEGMVLRARGPIGRFCFEPDKDAPHVFMVAGGSGVTPFVSMMREYAGGLGEPHAPQKMTLVVSYRSTADLILWNDLVLLNKTPGMRVVTTLSREHAEDRGFWYGRLTEDLLAKAIGGDYTGTTFMTCGPQAIMDLTVAHVKGRGVEDGSIKLESFES